MILLNGLRQMSDVDWSDNSIKSHQYPLNVNQTFLVFLQDNALSQLVNSPTRGSNILDLFITNKPSLVESYNIIDGISGHEAVLVSSTVLVPYCHPARRSVYLWSLDDFDQIRQEIQFLCEELSATNSSSTPVNVLWNDFLSKRNTDGFYKIYFF